MAPRFGLVHVAWLAMFLNILNWRLRDVVASGGGDLWDFYRIGLAFIAGLIALRVLLQNGRRMAMAFTLPILMLLIYAVVGIISSVLVVSSVSFYSMWKGIEVFTVVFVMAAILSVREPWRSARAAYEILLVCLSSLLVVYAVEAIILPGEAFTASRGVIPVIMRGVMPITQQNALGFYSAVVAIAALAAWFRQVNGMRRMLLLVILIVALTEMLLAQSRTSVVGFILAAGVYLVADKRIGLAVAVVGVMVAGGLGWGLSEIAIDYLRRGQEDELILTLSGRTEGWALAWEMFKESPIFGYGFVAAARTEILGSMHTGGMSTLHGALFDVLIGVGMLGLFPWATAVIITVFRTFAVSRRICSSQSDAYSRSYGAEMLALLTLLIIRTSTSSGLAIHDHTMMLFLCLVAYGATMRNQTARAVVPIANPVERPEKSDTVLARRRS